MHNNNHPLSPLRVFIDPVKITSRGQGYSVSFNGEIIIANTRNPSCDACRHLVALGHQGRMEVWDNVRPYPRLVFHDIERAAGFTVAENEKHGPRIVRYKSISVERREHLEAKRQASPRPICKTTTPRKMTRGANEVLGCCDERDPLVG